MNLWDFEAVESASFYVTSQFYQFVPVRLHPMTVLGYNLKDGDGRGCNYEVCFWATHVFFLFSERRRGWDVTLFNELQPHPPCGDGTQFYELQGRDGIPCANIEETSGSNLDFSKFFVDDFLPEEKGSCQFSGGK